MKKILKRVFIILVILALLVVAWQVSLFVRVRNIEKKMAENFKGDYYYKEIVNSENIIEVWNNSDYSKTANNRGTNTWTGKKNRIGVAMGAYSQSSDDVRVEYLEDGEYNNNIYNFDRFQINNSYITNWDWKDDIEWYFKSPEYTVFQRIDALFQYLVYWPITSIKSITTETLDGKECYLIKTRLGSNIKYEFYVDKETCLLMKEIYAYKIEAYNVEEREYEYSIRPITNEEMNIPSLDNAYVIVD